MESLLEIDVVNSSSSELLASPLNITIQQNVNEDNNSFSQEPMKTIPVEQIDHINAKSQNFISPLYKADKCFDRIPIRYRETIMYVDPITRQTFIYATPIECGNNPQNIIELDPDTDDGDFYVLTPADPLKREAPQMFKHTQIKTTKTPNTFTAQDAVIYSNAELDQFWNRVLFAKH